MKKFTPMNNLKKVELSLLIFSIIYYGLFLFLELKVMKILYTISMFSLSGLYFYCTYKIYPVNKNQFLFVYSIFSGAIYSIGVAGICFWMNKFYWYSLFLLISSSILLLLFLPLSFLKYGGDAPFYKGHRLRSIFYGAISLIIYLSDFYIKYNGAQ